MRKRNAGLSLAVIAGVGLSTAAVVPANAAQPVGDGPRSSAASAAVSGTPQTEVPSDALPNPLADKQAALREKAIADVLSGVAKPQQINGSTVVQTGTEPTVAGAATTQPQYVQLSRETTDRVFTLVVEFGNKRDPRYPDATPNPDALPPTRFNGPLFNQIPKPGPDDNSTQWDPNYDRDHYQELYFGEGRGVESLKSFYQRQSSGRYSITGRATEVVKVPFNEARYGRSINGVIDGVPCSTTSIVCANTWALIGDGMTQWYADRKAVGATEAEIAAQLRAYDRLDRYDYDGDGDFNEPDGYIDRFQIVHAGGDESDGDPLQGGDAIWSHRWYTHGNDEGVTGPAYNKLGGTRIGTSNIWVGDYTVGPENGGLSVIAHEYGHDLGLPDHYDTQGGGDNPVNWWTLMAQSRLSATGDQGIATHPGDLGVWDKLQLGWLDYETVVAGQQKILKLGPHEFNTNRAQAVAVVLPDKTTTTPLVAPASGASQWWSGAGDDYDASMSRVLDVPTDGATLDLSLAYNIEEGYDYAYLEVESPVGSGNWTALDADSVDPDGAAGIDGASATYKPASFDLADFAGEPIGFRVRYATDGAVQGQDPTIGWSGIFIDDISITAPGGDVVLEDGAENPPNGWTLDGFSSVGGSIVAATDQFYLASNRSYTSQDRYLRSGPYNFSFPDKPDRVEHFGYQNGLLVNYWDAAYSDNNTSAHPGHGLVLPIDANPEVKYNLNGLPWRGRIQTYDAPFSTQKSDSFSLTVNGLVNYIRGSKANPLFDDSDPNRYYTPYADAGLGGVGVITAGAGVKIEVLQQHGRKMTIKIF